MGQTVGLAMLIKDEAETLPETLPAILPAIDTWTVMDTGSCDGTEEVVLDILGEHSDGLLVRRPFDGFGPSRTALLEAARNVADYTLMLDADHTLHIHGERPEFTADAYLLRIEDAWGGSLPLLTRNSHPFEYRGVAHSYLASDHNPRIESTDWLTIDGGPGASVEKLERDLKLLTSEFAKNPNDPRTVFYLAQTYRDLDRPIEAIRFYRLRTEMDGFDEETYYARFQLGVLLSGHVSFAAGAEELLRAWRERPTRVEALRALAAHAEHVADKYPLPADRLFVNPANYKE